MRFSAVPQSTPGPHALSLEGIGANRALEVLFVACGNDECKVTMVTTPDSMEQTGGDCTAYRREQGACVRSTYRQRKTTTIVHYRNVIIHTQTPGTATAGRE